MAQLHPIDAPNVLRELQQQQRAVEDRLRKLEGRRLLAMDRLTTADVPAPVEGQLAVEAADDEAKYYANGQWRSLKGSNAAATNPIDLRNPTVGAYFALKVFTGITIGSWFFKQSVSSTINGAVICPSGASTFGVSLGFVSSTAATGNAVIRVSTRAVPSGTAPGGTFVAETDQTIAIGGSLTIVRFPTSGNLGSTPTEDDLLLMTLTRVGTSGSDTLAADLMMMSATLDAA